MKIPTIIKKTSDYLFGIGYDPLHRKINHYAKEFSRGKRAKLNIFHLKDNKTKNYLGKAVFNSAELLAITGAVLSKKPSLLLYIPFFELLRYSFHRKNKHFNNQDMKDMQKIIRDQRHESLDEIATNYQHKLENGLED